MASELLVESHGLTKRYGASILAVDNLDLRVRRGEVYGFLGPNGAGKTTTLRMLLGLIRPTSGSATVAGRPPGDSVGLAKVGAIVESPAFYPYLSGRDNLVVMADYCELPRNRVEGALDQVELTPRAKDKFSTYSLGMKQRLGVAATLIKEPDLLILDEPTNGLDPAGMVDMRKLIRDLGRGDRTVLISSHLLNEVEQICDRIGVIQSGRLVAEGTISELRGEVGVLVRATPQDKARDALQQLLGAAQVTETDGAFNLKTEPGRAAEINRALVQAGVDVSELRPNSLSLEEVFLNLTSDEAGL
jgi:ABC-2 type transport system ATP-binding protein